jgi:mRNA interferase RelE/StbE
VCESVCDFFSIWANIKKLKGFDPKTWRYRIGAWRFFYGIDDKEQIVFMLAASHRSSAY